VQHERLRALGNMASGIAHDINNALSPAMLYAQLILERDVQLSASAREYLQLIRRALEDITGTVKRMRDFYRPQESLPKLIPLMLNTMLREVLDLTRARWQDMPQERGIVIEVQTDFSPDVPAIVGDESEVRDALTNLVLNAVDAMPEGGTLLVRTQFVPPPVRVNGGRNVHGSVLVEITDTGIGMDEGARAHCLEPFYTTKGERGTGLGLAMVYGMVQRHDARIEVDSEVGRGTTMRLVFTACSM
jgi:signal transduction histidine kinase